MDSCNWYQEATIHRESQSTWRSKRTRARRTSSVRWQCLPSPGRKFRSITCILTSGSLSTIRSTTSLNGPTANLWQERGIRRAPGHHALQLPSVSSSMITESIAWFTIFYFGNGWIPTDTMAFVLFISQAQATCNTVMATSLSTSSSHVTTVSTSPSPVLKGCLHQVVEPLPLSALCQDQHLPEGSGCEHAARVRPEQMATHWGRWEEAEIPALEPPAWVFFPDWATAAHPMYFQCPIIMTMVIAKTGGLCLGHQLVCPFLHHLHFFCDILAAIFSLNFIRFLESYWFVWVMQMNNIIIEIDQEPYVTVQQLAGSHLQCGAVL